MYARRLLPGDYALSRWKAQDDVDHPEVYDLLWIIIGKFSYDERQKNMITILDAVDHDVTDEDYDFVLTYFWPKNLKIVSIPYGSSDDEDIWKIARVYRDGEEIEP